MVHIKNILADCNGDLAVTKLVLAIEGSLAVPKKRHQFAVEFAKLINSFNKIK